MRILVSLCVALVACSDSKEKDPAERSRSDVEPVPSKYYMVDEFVKLAPADVEGRDMRVHGWVKAGSIIAEGQVRRFELTRHGKSVLVVFRGAPPDTLRDQAEVVARGKPVGGAFEASELNTKCPSKYDGAAPGKPAKFE